MNEPLVFSDLTLARRLERAEGQNSARFVETRARISPESAAEWIEVAGAYAMFDGVSSPLTQTFGLGLFQPATGPDLEAIEVFYKDRGAAVSHEVSPFAGVELAALLSGRGYRPVEFTSVMFRPISPDLQLAASPDKRIRVRTIGSDEAGLWAQTAARGWSEAGDFSELMHDLARISAMRSDAQSFLAELEGEPIGTGALCLTEGVALLAGASTVPERRKLGAQLALLDSRLRYGAAHGCDLAMMCAHPGSASQRNAERHGFRIAYTRIKWQLG